MVNYEISPMLLKPYLPAGTELDYFEGKLLLSLVGFMFLDTKIFGVPVFGFGNFEEINLRFYVIRKEAGSIKRGVVFINETVPYKIVAWLANKLYKEHYTAIPTGHTWSMFSGQKEIEYRWQMNNSRYHINVNASSAKNAMKMNSTEEFIFEHYYGYTKVSDSKTEEYKVEHPRWLVNKVNSFDIHCNFETMYGKDFGGLAHQQPTSVLLAEGSEIAVKWKRNKLS
jgi:hypothetical protein